MSEVGAVYKHDRYKTTFVIVAEVDGVVSYAGLRFGYVAVELDGDDPGRTFRLVGRGTDGWWLNESRKLL